jgi:hypothetical protein
MGWWRGFVVYFEGLVGSGGLLCWGEVRDVTLGMCVFMVWCV